MFSTIIYGPWSVDCFYNPAPRTNFLESLRSAFGVPYKSMSKGRFWCYNNFDCNLDFYGEKNYKRASAWWK